jgi:hypothetical protein
MIDGRFEWKKMPTWREVEEASPLSTFFIKWKLPRTYIDKHGVERFVPIYPLPYRLPGGGILYPYKSASPTRMTSHGSSGVPLSSMIFTHTSIRCAADPALTAPPFSSLLFATVMLPDFRFAMPYSAPASIVRT